jgi:hypothetical protein
MHASRYVVLASKLYRDWTVRLHQAAVASDENAASTNESTDN